MPEPAILREMVERLFARAAARSTCPSTSTSSSASSGALNRGEVRAAEPDAASPSGWRVNPWVKQGILLGFRMGKITDMSVGARSPSSTRTTYPLRPLAAADGVRVVPGGSSIRDGAYLGRGVTCMPPMFVNAGA